MFASMLLVNFGLAVAGVQAGVKFTAVERATSPPSFQKPVLGYNTYNAFSCSPDETKVSTQIDALQSNGFVDAGYRLFGIDCGWQSRTQPRNANGTIAVDTTAFPHGVLALSQRATGKGMSWAMYSDAGQRACDTTVPSPVQGSLQHEAVDAAQFAAWNTTYLKYDNCYVDGTAVENNAPKDPRTDFVSRFSVMTRELRSHNINGGLTCQWGVPYVLPNGRLLGPVDWAKNISTSFRLSDDISDSWDSVRRIYNQAIHISASDKTGPGFHQDGDLLEVGNAGLTFAQQQTHFAYWAMIKSALLISTDVTALSTQEAALLKNAGLLAINQDDLGRPIKLVQRWTDDRDLFAGPLANGDVAVLGVNWQSSQRTLNIDFLSSLNITSADVIDLLTGERVSDVSTYSSITDAYAPLALRLSNVRNSTTAAPRVTYIEAESGAVSGNAVKSFCAGCSGGQKVGYIGGEGNTLEFRNVAAASATATVLFDYLNADIGYLSGNRANVRVATLSVNGAMPVSVEFPLSGYDFNYDVTRNYRVELTGFTIGSGNTITIGAPKGSYAPDIDRIGTLA